MCLNIWSIYTPMLLVGQIHQSSIKLSLNVLKEMFL